MSRHVPAPLSFPTRAYIAPGSYYHTTIRAFTLDEALAEAQAWAKDTFLPVRDLLVVPATSHGRHPAFNPARAIRVEMGA